ncbi:MAG: ASCH domain-containing protein [Elainellaceae cyanobacterium]
MLKSAEAIAKFWQAYQATLPANTPQFPVQEKPYQVNQFGDNPALIRELTQLVLSGTKTATCSALCEWEAEGEELPTIGSKTITLDENNQPVCIFETTEVILQPFNQVDAQFACDEGEDDRTLETWRQEHWKYFSRVLPTIGKEPSPTMMLVCERFRVVYPRSANKPGQTI